MFADELRSVLIRDDRVERFLGRLITVGMFSMSVLGLVGTFLMAVRGDGLTAISLALLALLFAWIFDHRVSALPEPRSRRLSRRAAESRGTTPDTRLELPARMPGQDRRVGPGSDPSYSALPGLRIPQLRR